MGLLSPARRSIIDIYKVCVLREGWLILMTDCYCVALCVCAFASDSVCFVRLRDILHCPCKSQRKGQALPEWLAGSKMRDFIYRAVNVSLTAAGFLGLSSVTGHLISHSLTLPGRKHTFCFQECCFSHPTMDFPNCKLFSS